MPAYTIGMARAGSATKTNAAAFVIFADGTFHETALNGKTSGAAQAEAVKFNLMAGTAAQPPCSKATRPPRSALSSASTTKGY